MRISDWSSDVCSSDLQIAPGYYMYRERFEVQVPDAQGRRVLYLASTLSPPEDATPDAADWGTIPVLPHGTVKYDPTLERDMAVYHHQVTVRLPVPATPGTPTVPTTGQASPAPTLSPPQ